jgi:hypothetical protein
VLGRQHRAQKWWIAGRRIQTTSPGIWTDMDKHTTIRVGLVTSFAALCLAATACGSETTATEPPAQSKQTWHQPYVAPGPSEHPPGSFHADTYCRSHPHHGLIRCGSNSPQRRVGHAYT